MVLGFKEVVADGTPTLFYEKIMAGVFDLEFVKEAVKLHSIREGERWRAGMEIQMSFGVRTKKYRQFNKGIKELSVCVSTQRIVMDYLFQTDCLQIYIEGRKLPSKEAIKLIHNDGLTRDQFINWFFSQRTSFKGQIVHWTNLKY